MRNKLWSASLAFGPIWLVAFASPALAQGFAAFISPPRIVMTIKPGETVRQVIDIQHAGRSSGQYRVYTNDWTLDENLSVNFSQALAPGSCRPWVAIERRELSLEPGARYRYRFEVRAPADAAEGECRFALMVEGRDPVGGVVQASGRIGVIVYAAIGNARPRLVLAGQGADSAQGSPSPFLLVRNDGKAHGRLEGFLEATDASGARLELAPADTPILPGETRKVALAVMGDGKTTVAALRLPLRVRGTLEWGRERLPVDAVIEP
jgi:hypothetical protein